MHSYTDFNFESIKVGSRLNYIQSFSLQKVAHLKFTLYYSTGQVLFPNAAYNPHQLNIASKKAKPEKNNSHGLQVVVIARIRRNRPITIRIALSFFPIFLRAPRVEFCANFLSIAR